MTADLCDSGRLPDSPADFRRLLQAELARRCARNPRYSVRAFAKFLGTDHATLSQWLRGRRRLTETTIRRLGGRLGLSEAAIDSCIHHTALAARANPTAGRSFAVQRLAGDLAEALAGWEHAAILELTHLHDFRPDSRWIARVLGIAADEVNIALQRLVRLGLLEMRGPREWIARTGDALLTQDAIAHIALQRLLAGFSRATKERGGDDVLPAAFSMTTIALHSSQAPAAIAALTRTRDDVLGLLRRCTPCDQVYQLQLAFFPLTDNQH